MSLLDDYVERWAVDAVAAGLHDSTEEATAWLRRFLTEPAEPYREVGVTCSPLCTPPAHRNPCLVAEAIAEGEAFERGD